MYGPRTLALITAALGALSLLLMPASGQAGFHASGAAGTFDGYQASVHVGSLSHGSAVLFAVQAGCVPDAPPPVYGPPTSTRPAAGVLQLRHRHPAN
jgi:hypothetical protein